MSKVSFRARQIDYNRTLPIIRYGSEAYDELGEGAFVNRGAPTIPSGMEREEENVNVWDSFLYYAEFVVYFIQIMHFSSHQSASVLGGRVRFWSRMQILSRGTPPVPVCCSPVTHHVTTTVLGRCAL